MNRELLLFTILFIFQYSLIVSDDDCSSFEALKEEECFKLKNTSHQCYYSNNKCYGTEKKTSCSSYTVTTGTINEQICTSITLEEGSKKKCIVKNNACVEDDIVCEDFKDSASCLNFQPGTNKRCIFNKNKCETHYDKCEYIVEEIKCNSNIPDPTKETDGKNKCSWDSSSCKAVDRKCIEYTDIKEISSFPKSCKDLVATSPKICILDESNNCIEALAGCSSYTGEIESECNSYKSIDNSNKIIPSNKCAYDSSRTTKCYDLPLITCDSYNNFITVPENRVGTDCTKIIPYKDEEIDEHSKCEYDITKKECTNQVKNCTEIEDEIICRGHTLKDTDKQCIFMNNKCIEQYKTCSLYNEKAKTKTKPECIAIQENESKRCNFTDKNECVSVDKKECNEYQSGEPEEYCTTIKSSNDTYRCAFIENQCIEQFKSCGSYASKNDEVLNREICESIIHTLPNMRCVLKNDATCEEKKKECSDYTGDIETECITNYEPLDEKNYKCAFKDNKCIEIPSYTSCSQYIGKDKDICESINLSDSVTYKCSLVNERCQKVEKPCSDGKNIEDCKLITPKDTKKECVFLKGICTELYKTCQDYNDDTNVKKIDKDICESIISKETTDGTLVIKTCVYTEGEGEAKGSCTSRQKYCEDFSSELYQTNCNSIELTDKTQKCIYNAGTCSVSKKNCLDVIFLDGEKDIETKCQSLPVEGQNKICTVKSDNKGCKEEDKPKDPTTIPGTTTTPSKGGSTTKKDSNSNNERQGDENNSGKEIYLNKLIIIILCLLF